MAPTHSHINLLRPLILIVMFCTAVTGCGPSQVELEKTTEQISVFHQALNKADYATIVQATDYEYRKSSQQDDLAGPFRAVHEKYGNVLDTHVNGYDAHRMIGATRIVLRQTTRFERGDVSENFTFLVRDHIPYLLRYEVTPLSGK